MLEKRVHRLPKVHLTQFLISTNHNFTQRIIYPQFYEYSPNQQDSHITDINGFSEKPSATFKIIEGGINYVVWETGYVNA